jgi:hypothetical protein
VASPALIPRKKVTEGYFKVPNSFLENLHLLKLPASVSLALMIFRAESEPNGIRTISDRRWESWTGKKDRQKEYAVKELQAFGLVIEGRGDTTKFSWDWGKWNEAVKTQTRVEDQKAEYRKTRAVTATPGAKVHEECRDQGCKMLRDCPGATECDSKPLTALFVVPNAHPSAQTPAETVETPPTVKKQSKQTTPSVATPNAHPSAQTPKNSDPETEWALTLAAMRSGFASAGVDLLTGLLTILRAAKGLREVSDYVLAEAVKEAYADSRGRWNSAVMLKKTVPDVLKGWKAKGQPMDDTGEVQEVTHTLKKFSAQDRKDAKRILKESAEDGSEWQDADIQWAHDVLASSGESASRGAGSVRPGRGSCR